MLELKKRVQEDKKYLCIFIYRGQHMIRNRIYADTLAELYQMLTDMGVIAGGKENLSDQEYLRQIYLDCTETIGHLTVYRYNDDYDEDIDYESDKYIVYRDEDFKENYEATIL